MKPIIQGLILVIILMAVQLITKHYVAVIALLIMAMGGLLNAICVYLNNGKMPAKSCQEEDERHKPWTTEIKAEILSDFLITYSIGDILAVFGFVMGLFAIVIGI